MPLPKPQIGLVIEYAYLWKDEFAKGRTEGTENRPCMIADIEVDGGERIVTLFPITHSPPRKAGDSIEIPARTKFRLGMDDERSWIVVTEANEFTWPGPDIRMVSRNKPAYGQLPENLVNKALSLSKSILVSGDAVNRD